MKKRQRKTKSKSKKSKSKKSKAKKHKYHRIKHHGKLVILLTSKIVLVFIAFIIGLYVGNLVSDPPLLIFIAAIVGLVIYLLGIFHVIKWLKI